MEALLAALLSPAVGMHVVLACLLSVPATHAVGLHLYLGRRAKLAHYLVFPFKGGTRHVVLQLLSWTLWGFAALMSLPLLLSSLGVGYSLAPGLPRVGGLDVIAGSCACILLIAQLFSIKAILVYQQQPPTPPPPQQQQQQHEVAQQQRPAKAGSAGRRRRRRSSQQRQRSPPPRAGRAPAPAEQQGPAALKPHPVVSSAVVVLLGLLLSLTGFLLLLALESMPDVPSRLLYCCLSLSCLLIAASTTHGLGGFLRFGGSSSSLVGSDGPDGGMWKFVQPFAGGTAFVAMQTVSWSLFAATVVLLVLMIAQLGAMAQGVALVFVRCVRCWALSAGTLMVLAQAMLGASLLLYRSSPKGPAAQLAAAAAAWRRWPATWLNTNLPVMLMYMPVHVFFTLWALSFAFLPAKLALAGWAAFLVPYYLLTHSGAPAHTGCRQWPWLMAWFEANIEAALANWFGSVAVLYDGDATTRARAAAAAAPAGAAAGTAADGEEAAAMEAAAEPQQQQPQQQQPQQQPQQYSKLMFGFQPHGFYPTGTGFLPWMPSFGRAFPGVRPITLSASVMFAPPFIRDIVSWAGFRQVSRHTFLAALLERRSVIFCPGGMAEMVHAWRAFQPQPELVLHTRHKGFCRIAVEQQAALVPVLALGESLQVANLIDLPALQTATYRKLGFPCPFLLVGRWGVTPLPRPVPLLYVIGAPLPPPPHEPGTPADPAAVDALHARYYAALQDLFARYRHLHPVFGSPHARFVLTDD